MKSIPAAIAWAALLIGLPLFARTGLVTPGTLSGIAPTLTALAVVHLVSLGRNRRCLATRNGGEGAR